MISTNNNVSFKLTWRESQAQLTMAQSYNDQPTKKTRDHMTKQQCYL